MAFRQLYYTSCADGLAGYGGYQFNAATPGVPAAVMREVEDRTGYEPPRSLPSEPRPDELDAFPIAFSHTISEADGVSGITAQVVFAGKDYSGRPGNYFAHALVSDTPRHDFGPVLPVELWGAPLWQRLPVEVRDLPELAGPPPRGPIDRAGTQDFIDTRHGAGLMPMLLSAVGLAMAGDRPVLLVGQDSAENARWIAAISYLLGERLGHRLSFTTYSHRPGYSRHHVIGVLAGDGAVPADADLSFHLADFGTGRTPEVAVHPLAELLGRVGVMSAAALWQQAVAFMPDPPTGSEGLDAWHPPVAAAAALLGLPLSPYDLDLLAGWLPERHDELPDRHGEIVLGALLNQPADSLTDARLRGLLRLARELRADERTERLEGIAAERALDRLARGEPVPEPVAEPIRLTGQGVLRTTALRCADLLRSADPATVAEVLTWAESAGVALPSGVLESCGADLLRSGATGELLAGALTGRPAVVRGLVASLARIHPRDAEAVFEGPAGAVIDRRDLGEHPGLTELWLCSAARQRRMAPMDAFDQIRDVRNAVGRPFVEAELLGRLWPDGCRTADITALLGALAEEQARAPDVLRWLAREIAEASRRPHDDAWLELTQTVHGHPILPHLPDDVRTALQQVARVAPSLRRARKGESAAFGELYGAYAHADGRTRRMLESELSQLLTRVSPLNIALRGCPAPVFNAFRAYARFFLRPPAKVDYGLAARLFLAAEDAHLSAQQHAGLDQELDRILEWRRRDLKEVAKVLDAYDQQAAERFTRFYSDSRPTRTAKLMRFLGRTDPDSGAEPPVRRR